VLSAGSFSLLPILQVASLSLLSQKAMPTFFIVTMTVEEEGRSTLECLVEPNVPVFACLNLAFPQASWDATQSAASVFWFFL